MVVDKYLELCKETVPEAKRLLLGCKCDLIGCRTVAIEVAEVHTAIWEEGFCIFERGVFFL